jgi:hypothetical protein
MKIQEEDSKIATVIQSGQMSARVSPTHSRNFETIHEEEQGAKTLRKSNPYA